MKPKIQIWDIDKLIPYEKNAKIHDRKQVGKIAESIKLGGWMQPIVVDRKGEIIAGHGRRLAAIKLRDEGAAIPQWKDTKQVPVWVRDDLDEVQVKALRVADNRVAESSIDTNLLRRELAEIAGMDFSLDGIFDAKELEFAAADLGALDDAAFVDDVGSAVDKQSEQVRAAITAGAGKPVPVAKVLGFKTVSDGNQIALGRFMAHVEHKTGLKGEEALAAFAVDFVE